MELITSIGQMHETGEAVASGVACGRGRHRPHHDEAVDPAQAGGFKRMEQKQLDASTSGLVALFWQIGEIVRLLREQDHHDANSDAENNKGRSSYDIPLSTFPTHISKS
jgi:hypothetical protein